MYNRVIVNISIIIFLVTIFISCQSNSVVLGQLKSGKYANKDLSKIEIYKLQSKFKKSFNGVPIVLLYLRNDSSFVFGYCENQVVLAGNYFFKKDSLTLYHIYNFQTEKKMSNMNFYVDVVDSSIYFASNNPHKNIKFKERVALLRRNNFSYHTGFLRNEDWPLDSLLKFNTVWPHEKQMIYLDSVLKRKRL